MTYICRCTDGPAKGKEFQDYGPPIIAEIPHKGQLLKYQLVSVLDSGCAYRFHGLSEERKPSSACPLEESIN